MSIHHCNNCSDAPSFISDISYVYLFSFLVGLATSLTIFLTLKAFTFVNFLFWNSVFNFTYVALSFIVAFLLLALFLIFFFQSMKAGTHHRFESLLFKKKKQRRLQISLQPQLPWSPMYFHMLCFIFIQLTAFSYSHCDFMFYLWGIVVK